MRWGLLLQLYMKISFHLPLFQCFLNRNWFWSNSTSRLEKCLPLCVLNIDPQVKIDLSSYRLSLDLSNLISVLGYVLPLLLLFSVANLFYTDYKINWSKLSAYLTSDWSELSWVQQSAVPDCDESFSAETDAIFNFSLHFCLAFVV